MVSRALTRLRIFLPALALVVLFGNLAPLPAHAFNRYEYTDGSEGDPGDGVLDPAVDDGTGGASDGKTTDLIINGRGDTYYTSWLLPFGDFYLMPMYLPGNVPGFRFVNALPLVWSRTEMTIRQRGGRWHNAP